MGNIHFTLGKSEFFVQKYNPPPKNPGGVFKFCPNIKTGGFFFIGRGGLIVDVKISGGIAEKGMRKINKKTHMRWESIQNMGKLCKTTADAQLTRDRYR